MTVESDKQEGRDPTSFHDNAKYIGVALTFIMCLAVDELNPVKVLCSYARWFDSHGFVRFCVGCVTEQTIALMTAFSLVSLIFQTSDRLIYNGVKLFFRCTFNNMFFRSIEIVGMDNLPKTGPVILTGNHNNQFVDGGILAANCHRQISFMIAQKSFDKPGIGSLARIMHCLPVTRPQDIVFKGKGMVSTDGTAALRGDDTNFLEKIIPGSSLAIDGLPKPVKVKSIVSETLIMLEADAPASDGKRSYKVTPKVEQSAMYDKVYRGLRNGQCLGIFPEGGSHDQTDLLPLKAGVAIIALDAYTKHHISVPIVPVGLNYFQGHRFGGRVVIEFGPPIVVPEKIYLMHDTDRRGATDALLKLVTIGMRSCIVPTTNYETLQQIYQIRRLYVPDGLKLSAEQTMDLNRRFAVGIQRILDMRQAGEKDELIDKDGGEGAKEKGAAKEEPLSPADRCTIDEFKAEVEDYMATLKRLGMHDHQVRQIGWWGISDLVGRIFYALIAIGVGFLPQFLFNMPVMFLANKWAAVEQKKALKSSTVKLKGMDVLMSYKVMYVLGLVPALYLLYGLIIALFLRPAFKTLVAIMLFIPCMSYLGTQASEQGMRAYKDIVPLFKRLLPGPRRQQDALPARRATLQKKLNAGIRKWGPLLGDLYKLKVVDWGTEMGWFTHATDRVDQMKDKGSPQEANGGSSPRIEGGKKPADAA